MSLKNHLLNANPWLEEPRFSRKRATFCAFEKRKRRTELLHDPRGIVRGDAHHRVMVEGSNLHRVGVEGDNGSWRSLSLPSSRPGVPRRGP